MRSQNTDDKIKTVLEDASILLHKCKGKYDESSEYQLLIRVINEQTTEDTDGKLQLKSKDDKTLDSSILQNPSDQMLLLDLKLVKNTVDTLQI